MRTNPLHRLWGVACVAFGLMLSAGCASHAQSTDPPQPQVMTLRAGERASIGGGDTLRFVRLIGDSRCPLDVQCVWAGDAEVMFEFSASGQTPKTFTLTLLRATAPIGTRWIHLIALGREASPVATLRIDDAQDQSAPDDSAPRGQ